MQQISPSCDASEIIESPKIPSIRHESCISLGNEFCDNEFILTIIELLFSHNCWVSERFNLCVDGFDVVKACLCVIYNSMKYGIGFVCQGQCTFFKLIQLLLSSLNNDAKLLPLIISGATGSGKSLLTGIAIVLVKLEQVIICQPRIMASESLSNYLNTMTAENPEPAKFGYLIAGFRTGGYNTDIAEHQTRFIEVSTAAYTYNSLVNFNYSSRLKNIMVDEAHERKADIDILLTQLKSMYEKSKSHLHIFICSATMPSPNLLFKYFVGDDNLHFENECTIITSSSRAQPLLILDVIDFNTKSHQDLIQLISKDLFPNVSRNFANNLFNVFTSLYSSVKDYYTKFSRDLQIGFSSFCFKSLAQICVCFQSVAESMFADNSILEGFTILVFFTWCSGNQ
ncbi:hypothetical protein GEMRC1_008203 [Eukaryota sp. GEM-RC1]